MSYTNSTANYQLPQYVGTDIPSILTDVNNAYQKIDTVIHEVSVSAGQSSQDVSAVRSRVDNLESSVNGLSSTVSSVSGKVIVAEEDIDNLESSVNGLSSTVSSVSGKVIVAEEDIDNIQAVIPDDASATNPLVTQYDDKRKKCFYLTSNDSSLVTNGTFADYFNSIVNSEMFKNAYPSFDEEEDGSSTSGSSAIGRTRAAYNVTCAGNLYYETNHAFSLNSCSCTGYPTSSGSGITLNFIANDASNDLVIIEIILRNNASSMRVLKGGTTTDYSNTNVPSGTSTLFFYL